MELTRMTGLTAALLAAIAGGGSVAWWLHRRTRVSPHCLYLAALAGPVALIAALASRQALGCWPPRRSWTLATMTAAALGRRWRLAALGAGGELREFEQARIALWRALARRARARDGAGRGGGRTSPARASWSASARGRRRSRLCR